MANAGVGPQQELLPHLAERAEPVDQRMFQRARGRGRPPLDRVVHRRIHRYPTSCSTSRFSPGRYRCAQDKGASVCSGFPGILQNEIESFAPQGLLDLLMQRAAYGKHPVAAAF
ncbi:hypothetical protein [Cereibacter sphaeroides]|uniref:hypothetical protein n=1 Tax=Cereibacter sphaeroides TaxID=1063 RepID=UPI0015FA6A93|nr:hypothetical protein [Cereibacter sphaeroides]